MLRRFLLLFVFIATGLVACGVGAEHQYVQSDDGSLSFRLPHEFTDVDVETRGLDWIVGLDASPSPSNANLSVLAGDYPFILAQSVQLTQEQRSLVSQQQLRTLAIPVSEGGERRDPLGDFEDVRLIFHEPFVDDLGFEGHVLQLELDVEGRTASEVQVVALNPERWAYHRVRIACTVDCMAENENLVADILSSIQMREAEG
ncbi:MAG: hypothetical protein ACR2P0_00060 [Acidimicrobiales bacterium]